MDAAGTMMERELDILCRLQYLEGVANVPVGTWSSKRDGLSRAGACLRDKGIKLHSRWLKPNDTHLYRKAWERLERTSTPDTADDIMQHILSGIGVGGGDTIMPFRQAGLLSGGKIRLGPIALLKGYVGFCLKNKIRDYKRAIKQQEYLDPDWDAVDSESEPMSAADKFMSAENLDQVWMHMVCDKTRDHKVLRAWLMGIDENGNPPRFIDIAQELGLSGARIGGALKDSLNMMAKATMPKEWADANPLK